MESNSFLVGISCMTYNHRNYIVDAMDGFTMQQTNFPFVAVIVDDASTDGEPEVISKYLEENFDLSPESESRQWENAEARYVFAQHKENKNCYFVAIFLKTNYYSQKKSKMIHTDPWLSKVKYLAFCEGDDYWIDTRKIQKQVSFLEQHPDYGMVYTAFRPYNQQTNVYGKTTFSCQSDFEKTLIDNRVGTLTTLIRAYFEKEYYNNIWPKISKRGWVIGDKPRWLYIMSLSKAKYLSDLTSIYRVLSESASHTTSYEKSKRFIICDNECSLFFAEENGVTKSLIKYLAIKEVEDLIVNANIYHTNLNFAIYKHLKMYKAFTLKRYVSMKLRSYIFGRFIYCKIKSLYRL
jgi:glycosyltransferase involved in cell wall biosynthesis